MTVAVRAVTLTLLAALLWCVGAGPAFSQEPDPSSSVSMFPSQLQLEVQRGEIAERTVGIVQTGEPVRELRFEITGDAASIVSIVDPADRTTPVSAVTVQDTVPSYVVVRIAPPAGGPEGRTEARIRLVSVGGSVTVGSELKVSLDVDGTWAFSATLLGVEVLTPKVEAGRPLRMRLDVDVRGSAALEPEVRAVLTGPDSVARELVERPGAVEPGGTAQLDVTWPTRDWPLGVHQGELVLRSRGVEVGRARIATELVPVGALTPAVTLLGAALAAPARAGEVAKVVVTVRNEGAIDGRVVFVGDLLRETVPISPVRSDPLLVGPGDVVELPVYVQLDSAGTYRVRGRANIDGVESSTVAVEIAATAASGRPWLRYGLLAGGAFLVVLVLVAVRRRSATATPTKGKGKGKGKGRTPGGPKAPARVSSGPQVSVRVRR